jgi:hypothetical protein
MLDKLKKLRHKYGGLISDDDEFENIKMNGEREPLKKLFFSRASNNIYEIAKKIKERASVYGIYRLNEKHEETCIKFKLIRKRLEYLE